MIETRMRDNLQSDMDALRHDLMSIRKDFAELTRGLVEAGQHGVRDLNDRVQQEVKHKAHQLRDAGSHAVDFTRHQIEERPLISVAGAFAAGLVIGVMLDRARA